MKCPRCGAVDLSERERDGIVVDVCPQCRGVWLDRGELERLQARAVQELDEELRARDRRDAATRVPVEPAPPAAPPPGPVPPGPRRDEPWEAPGREREAGYRRRDDDDDDDDDDRRYGRGRYAPHPEHGPYPPRKRRWFEVFDLFD